MQDPVRGDTPVLITEAAASYAQQLADRRRRYAILMSLRIPCLLAALVSYQTWWLALAFVAVSIPLPWVAVLIANDRPARKTERVFRMPRRHPELESSNHRG